MPGRSPSACHAADDLQPSQYLIDTAKRNIEGEISLDSASALINSYYEENRVHEPERTEEADKVSVRIAQLLSERAFVFSPEQYFSIHKRLFSSSSTCRHWASTQQTTPLRPTPGISETRWSRPTTTT